jgi:hypothetical protein
MADWIADAFLSTGPTVNCSGSAGGRLEPS